MPEDANRNPDPPSRAAAGSALSPTQCACLEALEKHGHLKRLPGGYWTWDSCARGIGGTATAWFGTRTVEALVRRGKAVYLTRTRIVPNDDGQRRGTADSRIANWSADPASAAPKGWLIRSSPRPPRYQRENARVGQNQTEADKDSTQTGCPRVRCAAPTAAKEIAVGVRGRKGVRELRDQGGEKRDAAPEQQRSPCHRKECPQCSFSCRVHSQRPW